MKADEVIAFIESETGSKVTPESNLREVCGDSLGFVDLFVTLAIELNVEHDNFDYEAFVTVQDVIDLVTRLNVEEHKEVSADGNPN